MRHPASCLTFVLISSLALAASAPPKAPKAQTPKARPRPRTSRPDEARNPYVERFKQLDRNGDGYVTLDEWPLDEASFRLVDRDRDGRLSPGELLQPSILRDQPAPYQLPLQEYHPRGPRHRNGTTLPVPVPHPPGSLWSPWATPRDQVRFRFLDRDHDGRLSRSEWMGTSTTFNLLDANHDGFITPDEWPR